MATVQSFWAAAEAAGLLALAVMAAEGLLIRPHLASMAAAAEAAIQEPLAAMAL